MKNLECVTLFVEDLAASKKFYLEIFDLKIVYEDPVSAVFKLESVMINLLKISEAPGLIVPAKVADSSAGQRLMFTVRVPNVAEVCGKLKTLGVQLLNGPQDSPGDAAPLALRIPQAMSGRACARDLKLSGHVAPVGDCPPGPRRRRPSPKDIPRPPFQIERLWL